MGVIEHFRQRLRNTEPTGRNTKGFDVRVIDFEGYVHLEMKPADAPDADRYLAKFSPSQVREFVEAVAAAADRVQPD